MNIFSFFSSKILKVYKSEINGNIKIIENKGKKTVYVGGAEQTGGTITGMWKKALKVLKKRRNNSSTCLILGLGGGDVIRILKGLYPNLKMTVVEIDPVMIGMADEFFGMGVSSQLKIIKDDAWKFLKKNTVKYDLIIIDLFIGFLNPQKFRKKEFLKLLQKSLGQSGFAVYNSHYRPENPGDFSGFYEYCRQIFPKASVLVEYPFSRIILLPET